jgi:hypothetical protein
MAVVKGYKVDRTKIRKVIDLKIKNIPNFKISRLLDLPVEIVREIDSSYLRDDRE